VAKQNYSFEKRQKEIAKKKKKEDKRLKKASASDNADQDVQPSHEADENQVTINNE
jgi:hypothetical protein